MTLFSQTAIKFLLIASLFAVGLPFRAQQLNEEELIATMGRATELQKANRHIEALELFLELGKNTEQQRTKNERDIYLYSQLKACNCYQELRRHEEAYRLSKTLREIKLTDKERKLVNSVNTFNGYMEAAKLILKKERTNIQYQKARQILLDIAPLADSTLAQRVLSRIPTTWYFEGMDSYAAQNFLHSKQCFQEALKGFEQGGRTNDKISVLKALASANEYLFEFDEAQRHYQTAFLLALKNSPVSEQITLLNMQWKLANEVGHLDLAQQTATTIDSLIETTDDAKAKYYYYLQKVKEAQQKGRLRLAEEGLLKAKLLAEADTAKVSAMSKEVIYIQLRDLYSRTNRFDEALHYAKLIMKCKQNAHAQRRNYGWLDYAQLADIYKQFGKKEECFACFDTLFRHIDEINEPKFLAHIYLFRGLSHNKFQNYTAALADFTRADSVLKNHYPPTDEKRLTLLTLMGGAAHQLGRNAEAERLYIRNTDYTRQLYGEHSMDYVNALIYQANAKAFTGNIKAGCSDYVKATNVLKSIMKERMPYLNDEGKNSFWTPVSTLFMHMTPYALKAGLTQTPFTESCYNSLILSKAFLLDSERSLYEVVKREGSEQDIRDYMQLSLMKNQLKKLERNFKHNADSILSLSRRADRITTRLANHCRSFSSQTDFMDIDYKAVKHELKPNEVLIDFADFVSKAQGRRYTAYVIRPSDQYPLLTDLFAESRMDSLGITRPDLYYDADFAPDVLQLLWKPLQKHIAPGSTVYYVPTQLLYRVALESLPLPDGSLLGQHYHFVRLSSARELLKKTDPHITPQPQSAVLYGGLHYDLQPMAMAEEARKYDLSNLMVMRGNEMRGDSIYHHLPGSRIEIMKIDSILTANHWHVVPRMGVEGTEESFLSMHENSPQVLQIATHGFYYTPDRALEIDYLKGYSDAMSLSGIVMSGANAAWLGKQLPKGVLSGILTAQNIARLDLSNTEMVVLSACQSGQGKATPEGLYGLQRAFKKAGVGTIVMALWNVSDRLATDFMVTFYEQLASPSCAWHKRKAFERTKAIIRNKYPDPFDWAAFVMLD